MKKLASRQPSPAGEGGSHRLTDEVSITVKFSIPLAHRLNPRPPTLLCGRADNACTNLLGYLVRYVRTRGMGEIVGSTKLPIFALPFVARTCHAWLARLTRARRGGSEGGRREPSLLTFAALLVTQKRDKRKVIL